MATPTPLPTPASTTGPALDAFGRYVDAINRGDVDAAVAAFAVDGRLQHMLCRPAPAQECVGHAAIRPVLEAHIAGHRCLTVLRAEEAGGVVTARVEVRADEVRDQGIERIVLTHTVRVAGDLIEALSVQADLGDSLTMSYSVIGLGRSQPLPPLPPPATPCV